MGIDDIKPPGAYRPLDVDAEAPAVSKTGKRFANGESEVHAAEAAGDTPHPFGVAAQFSRAALQDPAKLDGMVRAFASDLIDSRQSVTGALSGADRDSLLDFVSRDPLVRRHIETYLQKVLV